MHYNHKSMGCVETLRQNRLNIVLNSESLSIGCVSLILFVCVIRVDQSLQMLDGTFRKERLVKPLFHWFWGRLVTKYWWRGYTRRSTTIASFQNWDNPTIAAYIGNLADLTEWFVSLGHWITRVTNHWRAVVIQWTNSPSWLSMHSHQVRDRNP
jgi:hypothetical protein